MNVKNKAVIRRLAFRELKSSGKMNFVIVLSVILTCVLFTTLTSIGGGVLHAVREANMRQNGNSCMMQYMGTTWEDYEKISAYHNVCNVTYYYTLGYAVNEALADLEVEVNQAGSELAAEQLFSLPEYGKLPESENKIAVKYGSSYPVCSYDPVQSI